MSAVLEAFYSINTLCNLSISEKNKDIKVEYVIDKDKDIININKINIFVSRNNSGKSYTARSLLTAVGTAPTIPFQLFQDLIFGLKNIAQELAARRFNYFQYGNQIVAASHLQELIDVLEKDLPSQTISDFDYLWRNLDIIECATQAVFTTIGEDLKLNKDGLLELLKELGFFKVYDVVKKIKVLSGDIQNIQRIYIPNMRTLRNYENNFLTEKTKNEYSLNMAKVEIFDGQTLFEQIKKLRNSTRDNLKKVTDYENFLKKYFIHQDVFLYSNLDENSGNEVYLRIGDDKERRLSHVGEGLQSLIMMTFPLFFSPYNKIIVIEEIENNLHPAWLKTILQFYIDGIKDETLKEYSNLAQVFISTHNNHVIDKTLMSEKVNFFFLEKELKNDTTTIKIKNVKPSHEILHDLGVAPSSVLLSNCNIWLEGPSDVIYFRKFFELYKEKNPKYKHLIEGIHYSFQVLATAMWGYTEYKSETADQKVVSDFVNIAMISPHNIFLLDSDGQYDTEAGEFKPLVDGENQRVQQILINETQSDYLMNESVTRNYYHVNLGTVETYLVGSPILEGVGIKLRKKNGYSQLNKKNKKNKVKASRDFTRAIKSLEGMGANKAQLDQLIKKLFDKILLFNNLE